MRKLLLFTLSIVCMGCTHTRAVQNFLIEGGSHLDKKEYSLAREVFEKGLLENPDNEKLFYNRTLSLALEGKQEEALNLCDEGYKRWPNILNFLTLKYKILMQMERKEEAIATMDFLLMHNPSDTKLRLEIMDYALENRFLEEARFHAEFLISQKKEMVKAYKALATLGRAGSEEEDIASYLSSHPSTSK